MKRAIDDDLDSNCYAPPTDAEGPTDTTCGQDAATFVHLPTGVRRYICKDHADQVDRFGDVDDAHPTVVECKRCFKLTPQSNASHEQICEDCQV